MILKGCSIFLTCEDTYLYYIACTLYNNLHRKLLKRYIDLSYYDNHVTRRLEPFWVSSIHFIYICIKDIAKYRHKLHKPHKEPGIQSVQHLLTAHKTYLLFQSPNQNAR